jgi:hypothetical protein
VLIVFVRQLWRCRFVVEGVKRRICSVLLILLLVGVLGVLQCTQNIVYLFLRKSRIRLRERSAKSAFR